MIFQGEAVALRSRSTLSEFLQPMVLDLFQISSERGLVFKLKTNFSLGGGGINQLVGEMGEESSFC